MFQTVRLLAIVTGCMWAASLTACSSSEGTPGTPATSTPTAHPSAVPTASPSPTASPAPAPSPTSSVPPASAAYYECVGDPTVPAAQIATPDIALGGSTFPQGGPCAFISQGLVATCQSCNGLPDYINPTPESATCPGGCGGYPGSVTYSLQIASIPNDAPQFTGATFNIETTEAHLKIPSEIQPCSQDGNPYAVSGGGGTYTVTQTADPTIVAGQPLQTCVVDIYDQWGDGVVITMSPNVPPNQ